jgi:hypothetical protein
VGGGGLWEGRGPEEPAYRLVYIQTNIGRTIFFMNRPYCFHVLVRNCLKILHVRIVLTNYNWSSTAVAVLSISSLCAKVKGLYR